MVFGKCLSTAIYKVQIPLNVIVIKFMISIFNFGYICILDFLQ